MTCPELDALGPFGPETAAREALLACRDRIVGDGADLDQYNSASMAADAADVMRALEYERYSVFGVSYGTRVALTMLRDNPAPIDGVVLDSVYPPQVDFYAGLVLHQQEALERGLGACAADAACAAAYPNIVERMYALVAGATAAPLHGGVHGHGGSASDGRRSTGGGCSAVFIRAVTDTSYLGSLPKLIDEIERGDYGQLRSIVAQQESGGATGFGCAAADGAWVGGIAVRRGGSDRGGRGGSCGRKLPIRGSTSSMRRSWRRSRRSTSAWGVATRPALETEAVSSDVPVLILSGELDPTTPRAWADLAAETLSRSTVVAFRGLGHSVLFQRQTDCVMEIVAAFRVGAGGCGGCVVRGRG